MEEETCAFLRTSDLRVENVLAQVTLRRHYISTVMSSEEEEARYRAMVEFLGTFPTLSGAPPTDILELGDGVAIFEALSEM